MKRVFDAGLDLRIGIDEGIDWIWLGGIQEIPRI